MGRNAPCDTGDTLPCPNFRRVLAPLRAIIRLSAIGRALWQTLIPLGLCIALILKDLPTRLESGVYGVALILKGLGHTQTSMPRPLSYGGDFELDFPKKNPRPVGFTVRGKQTKATATQKKTTMD
jgi:hypothetical protein